MLQEECRKLAKHPDYQTLFEKVDLDVKVDDNGHFSIDKERRLAGNG